MKSHSKNGIHLRKLNQIVLAVSFVLFLAMMFNMITMSKRYYSLVGSADDYLICMKRATEMRAGSDYLTDCARFYVINRDPAYMYEYFTEVNDIQRRDKAVKALAEDYPGQTVTIYLEQAMKYSKVLMSKEVYAMKLVAVASDCRSEDLPQEIVDCKLLLSDLNMNRDEMLDKAEQIMFNSDYINAKALIQNNVDFCITEIMNTVKNRQMQSEAELKQNILQQGIAISLLFMVNVMTSLGIIKCIINPLKKYIANIKEGKPLDVIGAAEFQYLAKTYNSIYEQNKTNEKLLRNSAEHDGLTELLNRRVFDRMCEELRESITPISLMLVDIDNFKGVNDVYGHQVGDVVLKRVAGLLKEKFGENNAVLRLGGDEFAVIIFGDKEDLQNTIRQKIKEINDSMISEKDDFPSVTISAGVACSDCGFHEMLYRNADWALYSAKNNGKSGCEFCGQL